MIKITTRQFETDQQIYSKLLHIPKGEVCVLISDSFSEKQIKENLEILFNKRSRNVESAIRSLKLEELAQFIAWKENKNQPLKEIDELFNEYAYTNRPKIFLNEFFKKEAVTEKDFIDAINKTIKNANEHFENENEILPEFKDLSVSNTNEINGAFEATFGYSSRFDYIDPATEEPKFIYRLQKGFVWLIQSEKALIIKASSPRINHIIRYQLENLLSANIVTLILDKELIDDLIGFNTLVSGNWIDTTNAKNKFRSITIKDKETYKKTEGKKINNDYDRRSSSRHTIKNSRLNKNTIVHIVENFGTISFSCQLKKSNLQEWATNLMKETKKRSAQIKVTNIDQYLKEISPKSITALTEYLPRSSEKHFRAFLDILRIFVLASKEGTHKFKKEIDLKKIIDLFPELVQLNFEPINDGEFRYKLKELDDEALITYDGEWIDLLSNIKVKDVSEVEFIDGKEVEGSFEENSVLTLTEEGKMILNKVLENLDFTENLTKKAFFSVTNKIARLIKTTTTGLLEFDDVKKIYEVVPLAEIPKDKLTAQEPQLLRKNEQPSHKDFVKDKQNNELTCLPKILYKFFGGDYGPHHGLEFGDNSFKIENKQAVSVVKALNGKPRKKSGYKPYTITSDAGILSQTIKFFNESVVDVVVVATTNPIDGRLKAILETEAHHWGKQILIIELEHFQRMWYSYYSQGLNKKD